MPLQLDRLSIRSRRFGSYSQYISIYVLEVESAVRKSIWTYPLRSQLPFFLHSSHLLHSALSPCGFERHLAARKRYFRGNPAPTSVPNTVEHLNLPRTYSSRHAACTGPLYGMRLFCVGFLSGLPSHLCVVIGISPSNLSTIHRVMASSEISDHPSVRSAKYQAI